MDIKDACIEVKSWGDYIASQIQKLPTDYRLAETYNDIDEEIIEILEWYERVEYEKNIMRDKLDHINRSLIKLNNDVKSAKMFQKHGGSYSQLYR